MSIYHLVQPLLQLHSLFFLGSSVSSICKTRSFSCPSQAPLYKINIWTESFPILKLLSKILKYNWIHCLCVWHLLDTTLTRCLLQSSQQMIVVSLFRYYQTQAMGQFIQPQALSAWVNVFHQMSIFTVWLCDTSCETAGSFWLQFLREVPLAPDPSVCQGYKAHSQLLLHLLGEMGLLFLC